MNVLHVLLLRLRKDEYVVNVNKKESVGIITQHIVDQGLKHSKSIGQSKWHD